MHKRMGGTGWYGLVKGIVKAKRCLAKCMEPGTGDTEVLVCQHDLSPLKRAET